MYVFILLPAFLGCPETPLRLEKRCRPQVQEILDVQAVRDQLMEDLDADVKALGAGTQTEEEHRRRFQKWKAEEDRLRRRVTGLYDKAYAEGCL
jgi:hypothetical protein